MSFSLTRELQRLIDSHVAVTRGIILDVRGEREKLAKLKLKEYWVRKIACNLDGWSNESFSWQ